MSRHQTARIIFLGAFALTVFWLVTFLRGARSSLPITARTGRPSPDGLLGAFLYGPQSRVMDGVLVLARANCLLITTLWTLFKFVLVPIGAQLAGIFPRTEFAVVY